MPASCTASRFASQLAPTQKIFWRHHRLAQLLSWQQEQCSAGNAVGPHHDKSPTKPTPTLPYPAAYQSSASPRKRSSSSSAVDSHSGPASIATGSAPPSRVTTCAQARTTSSNVLWPLQLVSAAPIQPHHHMHSSMT